MKTKTKLLILLSLVVLCTVCVFLTSCGGDSLTYELSEDGEYYIVTGAWGNPKEITIPATYKDLPVKAIGDEAFFHCEKLESVTISNGITSIGQYAFEGCTSLSSVTLPESITTIGFCAFCDCQSLTSIDLPDSLQELDHYAFYSNPQLVEEVDGVYYVNDWALYYNKELSSITLREGTIGIASGFTRYSGTRISLNEIKIPDGVKIIGSEAFRGTKLSSVDIPSSVEYIGALSFAGTDLTSLVIPNGVKYIGGSAFANTFLKTVTVPSSVEYIGYAAFMHHSGTSINDGIIYCAASAKPSEWDEGWHLSYYGYSNTDYSKVFTVVWGN